MTWSGRSENHSHNPLLQSKTQDDERAVAKHRRQQILLLLVLYPIDTVLMDSLFMKSGRQSYFSRAEGK